MASDATLSERKATEGGKWFLLGMTACPLEGTHPPIVVFLGMQAQPHGAHIHRPVWS